MITLEANLSVRVAVELYRKQGLPKENLFTDITHYAINHYAYFSPNYLILAEVVTGPESEGWFIELAIGKNALQRFFEIAPFELPWIGFARPERNRTTKWYSWNKLKNKICHERAKDHTSSNAEAANSNGCCCKLIERPAWFTEA